MKTSKVSATHNSSRLSITNEREENVPKSDNLENDLSILQKEEDYSPNNQDKENEQVNIMNDVMDSVSEINDKDEETIKCATTEGSIAERSLDNLMSHCTEVKESTVKSVVADEEDKNYDDELQDDEMTVEKGFSNSSDSFASAIDNIDHTLTLLEENEVKELELERIVEEIDENKEEESMKTNSKEFVSIESDDCEVTEIVESLAEDKNANDKHDDEENNLNNTETLVKIIEKMSETSKRDAGENNPEDEISIAEENVENRDTNLRIEEKCGYLEDKRTAVEIEKENVNIIKESVKKMVCGDIEENITKDEANTSSDHLSPSVQNIEMQDHDDFAILVGNTCNKNFINCEKMVIEDKSENNTEFSENNQHIQDSTDDENEELEDRRNSKVSPNPLSENLEELPLKLFVGELESNKLHTPFC